MNWYPLTFNPIYKEKIWGGEKLNSLKNIQNPISKLGESWEISDVGDDVSIVSHGDLMGKSLKWLLENYGVALLGNKVQERFGDQFPLLIKYIDAAEDLSIQLHPDDKIAMAKHNSFGKTEMWYIMDADEDARLTLGFEAASDKSAFAKAISTKTLPALLNSREVSPGECFFVKPGLVHSIGAGVTLAEIQQSSDVTYRVYDFDRRDQEGNARDLHIDESIAAADYSKAESYILDYTREINGRQKLIETDYFKTDIQQFEGDAAIELHTGESFTILMNVGAPCDLNHKGKSYHFNHAQTYLLPAALNELTVNCEQNGKLLVVHL